MQESSATKMVWQCALALHAATPLHQLSLFHVCQSVIIFCNPRWKRVCFQGLRKGLAIGTGLRVFPRASVSSTGKGQRPQSTKRFNTRICHRTSVRKTDSKRVKVNGPCKINRHTLTHKTIESAAKTRGQRDRFIIWCIVEQPEWQRQMWQNRHTLNKCEH